MGDDVRIDKWLWAVRLFKTRTLASDACKKGRIMVNGQTCKPSRAICEGDVIEVKNPPVVYKYKVIALAEKRMGAKLVQDFMKDITPKDQIEILELQKIEQAFKRDRGLGRPTKKERRDIDKFTGDV